MSVVRDENVPRAERMEAAAKAAPYVHPRLAAIEHRGACGGPIQVEPPLDLSELNREERALLRAMIERRLPKDTHP